MHRIAAVYCFVLALAGCYTPALQTNGPLRSSEGVRVWLIGQDCAGAAGSASSRGTRTLSVKLGVENPTNARLTFLPPAARLLVGESSMVPVEPKDVISIPPRTTGQIVLRYLNEESCSAEFAITLDEAFFLDGSRVGLGALRFRPY